MGDERTCCSDNCAHCGQISWYFYRFIFPSTFIVGQKIVELSRQCEIDPQKPTVTDTDFEKKMIMQTSHKKQSQASRNN